MLKKTFVVLLSSVSCFSFAQKNTQIFDYFKSFSLEHVAVSANVGTMGISLEASTPVNEWVNVRAGLNFMPTINATMGFGVQVGDEKEKKYDANGNRIETKFEKMASMMKGFTGYEIDDRVDMACEANWTNAKVMVDVLPFSNKDWHFTAGFYWGTKIIGRACNTTEDMTTTVGVGIYNSMYERVMNLEPVLSYPEKDVAVYLPYEFEEALERYGRMGMHVGDFNSTGKPYMMVPDKDGTVRAKAKVNSFKPYVGFGWDHAIADYSEWRFGFDAGILFWGGVPNVYIHDGTSLTQDVDNLEGKVGRIISLVNCFSVYPVLEFKITRKIF